MGATEVCEPKGELVGSVYLSPNSDGTRATVTYTTFGEYKLQQMHLYMGGEAMWC